MPQFAEWESFYVIVGSGAAALIGLQFVVMTLIADKPQLGSPEAGDAFATPTIVHFSAVLFLSAVLRAPWHSITAIALVAGLVGVARIVYMIIVMRTMRRQTTYQPQSEDWLFHAFLPLIGYAMLVLSGLAILSHADEALFAVGAGALLLLFIGIHNAWDTVAYHVFVNIQNAKAERR